MLANKVVCPHCSKRLKTKQPLVVGKRVLCSGCGSSFAVRPDAIAPSSPTPVPQPPPVPASLPDYLRPNAGAPTAPAPAAIPVLPLPPSAPRPAPIMLPLPPGARSTALRTQPGVPAAPATGPRPAPSSGAGSGTRLALAAGIIAGLLLLGGGTALAVVLALKSEKPAVARATPKEGPRPGKEDSEASGRTRGALAATPRPEGGSPGRAPIEEGTRPTPPPPSGGDRLPKLAPPAKAEPRPEAPWLPREEQAKVDAAIARGVKYLRSQQKVNGTWENGHIVGMTALPALTLLECGGHPADPDVQRAARYVRGHIQSLRHTYSLSLAILFLDRLGDPGDEYAIQTLALRLVAGQTATGGWHYDCPILSKDDQRDLLVALRQTRPKTKTDLFVKGPTGRSRPDLFVSRPGKSGPGDFPTTGTQPGTRPDLPESKPGTQQPGSTIPGPSRPATERPGETPVSPAAKKAIDKLPPHLREVPALKPASKAHKLPKSDPWSSDNSNTQFAALALWAAGRHDLPLERSLALLSERFRTSQAPDGSWGYRYARGGSGGTPAMTGSGLLGLAVGHGLVAGDRPGAERKGLIEDPDIDKGLKSLSQHIGKPIRMTRMKKVAKAIKGKGRGKGKLPGRVAPRIWWGGHINLYFLWSVERVAMLYSLRLLDEKDWYGWGVDMLLEKQEIDERKGMGSWHVGGYPGSGRIVDTCFALLFLKRANFATDLSDKLGFDLRAGGAGP